MPQSPRSARTSDSPQQVLLQISTHLGYGRSVLEGIQQFVYQHADWLLEHDLRPRPALPTGRRRAGLAGVIAEARDPALVNQLRRLRTPVVTVTGVRQSRGLPQVISDNHAVGRMAFDHLCDLGMQKYAYYGPAGAWYARERGEAFAQAAQHAGRPCHVLLSRSDKQADTRMTRWLKTLPKPIGLLAANDLTARQVAHAALRGGILVPEQIAILGVDNDELVCDLTTPTLTSIDNGTQQIGYRAAQLLHDMMQGHTCPDEPIVVPPVGVVTRASTDTLAMDRPELVKAVRLIREEACRGITVSDVLDAVPVSRRTLEMNFKRVLRRTIQEEITRIRIERTRQLLIHTDLATPDIAARASFSSASQLSVIFKRETGLTPSAYRKTFRAG